MVLDRDEVLSIAAARGLARRIVKGVRTRLGEPIAGWIAAAGEPLILDNAHPAPHLGLTHFPQRGDLVSSMCLPIKGAERVLGVLNLNNRLPGGRFDQGDLRRGALLASLAAAIIEHAGLTWRLQEATQQVQRYRLELINVREDERRRIARELHDNALQSLADIIWQLSACRKHLTADPARVRIELRSATRSIRTSIREIRDVCQDLRPIVLEGGLLPALEAYVAEFEKRTGATASFAWEGRRGRFPLEVESSLFRIVQEALSNVRKHARARRVRLRISVGNARVDLRVEDDGSGFDPRMISKTAGRGFGLANIRERVQLLGGEFVLTTAPQRGTRLHVRIPLETLVARTPAPGEGPGR